MSFISRPNSGQAKRISVIEKRRSGFILLFGNSHFPGKIIRHSVEVERAYIRRDWAWFEEQEALAQIESSPNNRR